MEKLIFRFEVTGSFCILLLRKRNGSLRNRLEKAAGEPDQAWGEVEEELEEAIEDRGSHQVIISGMEECPPAGTPIYIG